MAVFASRQIVLPVFPPVAVTITGFGNANYCYAEIRGTKHYFDGTHEVNAGETITFGVYGFNYSIFGSVTIDGTQVLKVMNSSTRTYDWTVPNRISAIEIAMQYVGISGDQRCGKITVTTA